MAKSVKPASASKHKESDSEGVFFSRRRTALILLLSLALAFLILGEVSGPLRQRLSRRYIVRGDAYMVQENFLSAAREYEQAVAYDGSNIDAANRLVQAEAALTDPAAAEPFFAAHQVGSALDRLAQARQPFENPKTALSTGVQLYTEQHYAYARYALERAVQLDEAYPEAWHYLALDYQKLGEIDQSYKSKADEAFKRRDALTPKYLDLK